MHFPALEDNSSSTYYRSADSISNFKIRVRLEKQDIDLSKISLLKESTSFYSSRKCEERIFGWQEKVYGRREIEELSTDSHLDLKYKKEISVLKATSDNLVTRLFTYVNHDNYSISEKSMSKTTATKDDDKNLSICKNRFTSEDFSVMYVMADLSATNSTDEVVLCTLKYQNKVLSVKPDFNWNNKPYIILSKGREVYQYTLAHASKSFSREEQDREFKLYQNCTNHDVLASEPAVCQIGVIMKIYCKHNDVLQTLVGSEFELPFPQYCRVFMAGEILSAQEFGYDHLSVSWFVDLPEGWSKNKSQLLSGATQTCSKNKGGIVHFSYPFSLDLTYNTKQRTVMAWPKIYVEVMSADAWSRCRGKSYGYVTLPCSPGYSCNSINCWRPQGSGFILELKRYFIGNCYELEDISYIARPSSFETGHLSKFSFKAISSGKVTLKFYTVNQSLEYDGTPRASVPFIMKRHIPAELFSIQNVIEPMRKAKSRLRIAQESLLKE